MILEPLIEPPKPLKDFVSGNDQLSKHFLNNIQKYNSSFQMTSFGATKIVRERSFMPTFKIQGQIYHQIGSLLPHFGEDSKFMQIYFMGNNEDEIDKRNSISNGTRREIIVILQKLFHIRNHLVRLFKTSLDRMPTDDYQIIIRADKTPSGEHKRRFNAPMLNEVAIVMVGAGEGDRRDIVINRRDETLNRIAETHRSYDALQYPIIFWQGEDGYNFNEMQVDPVTKKDTTKKVLFAFVYL